MKTNSFLNSNNNSTVIFIFHFLNDNLFPLQCICAKDQLSHDVGLAYVALKCAGFVAGDLVTLVRKASSLAMRRTARENYDPR